jgi:hypothetical protein
VCCLSSVVRHTYHRSQQEHPNRSRPTHGTSLRLTASSVTGRTVQRARPSRGLLHTIAIRRCSGLHPTLRLRPASAFVQWVPIRPAVTTANIAYGLRSEWNCAGARRDPKRSEVADAYLEYAPKQFCIRMIFIIP